MFTNYNYLVPENRQEWKSAYEIERSALAHENLRIQFEAEEQPKVEKPGKEKQSGFLTAVLAPFHMLAALLG